MGWSNVIKINSKSYACGYCGNLVASNVGYFNQIYPERRVYNCPHCDKPSYITPEDQLPGVAPGNEVKALPTDIDTLYREARNAVAASAYTASVLTLENS